MFARDQKIIAAYAAQSADNLLDVLAFVQLTIQQPIGTAPAAMQDVRRKGAQSRFLWGNKGLAYAHASEHKAAIYSDFQNIAAIPCPDWQRREAMTYFARFPGLGLIKAGFVCQLTLGQVGCIDTHNIARFGLQTGKSWPAWLKAWEYKKRAPAARAAYLDAYLACADNAGGCEALWNDWCAYVATKYPVQYPNADYVSRLHVKAICHE